MKLIVLAQEVAAHQWLGRILNEAGLCDLRLCNCRSNAVEFINSIGQAGFACNKLDSKDYCVLIAWSPGLSPAEKKTLLLNAKWLVLVDHTTIPERLAEVLGFVSNHKEDCPVTESVVLAGNSSR